MHHAVGLAQQEVLHHRPVPQDRLGADPGGLGPKVGERERGAVLAYQLQVPRLVEAVPLLDRPGAHDRAVWRKSTTRGKAIDAVTATIRATMKK